MGALRRGLGETANDNSTAFGFSLTIGGTALILADVHGSPAVGEAFLLIAGAAAAMIAISALSTSGFRTDTAEPLPERAQMRGSGLNFLSVGIGMLAAWGAGELLGGGAAWAAGGFAGILLYLIVESLEYAVTLSADEDRDRERSRD